MATESADTLRKLLVGRLTQRADLAWTCTSTALLFRRGGRPLCSVEMHGDQLTLELIAPAEHAAAIDGAPFVGPPTRAALATEPWRKATPSTPEEVDQILAWLA